MEYQTTILDRKTGELVEISRGEYVTVTELGIAAGLGPRKIRAVLVHLGLMRAEGSRFRLAREAVARGYGIRHDRPRKGGYPFDVLSPEGQRFVVERLPAALTAMESAKSADPLLARAAAALQAYSLHRLHELTAQMQVCWLRDFFPTLTLRQIAKVLDVSEGLAERYSGRQTRQREYMAKHDKGRSTADALRPALADQDLASSLHIHPIRPRKTEIVRTH